MIVLGLILLLIGLLVGPSILTTIGIILLIVGLVLNLVPIGGTRRRVFQRALDEIESLQEPEVRPALRGGEALAAQKAAGDVRALPIDDAGRDVAEAG